MDVSVIMPVYNAASFLAEGVRSALEQPEVREVLLVEDGSTDGSLEACQALAAMDHRVRMHRHPGGANRGASASRNLGIRVATGMYIAFLDADDRYLPERFRAERELFASRPDAEGVYGAVGWQAHDPLSADRFKEQYRSPLATIRLPVPPEELFNGYMGFSGILGFGHIHLDGLTVKRAALLRLNHLFREELLLHQDVEFIQRLAWHLRLWPGSIGEAVALRGVHANNRVTNNPSGPLTRLHLYEAQWAWAKRDGLPGKVVRKFGRDTAHQRMLTAGSTCEKAKALATVLRYPGTLKRLDSCEALIGMLFGRQSGAARAGRRTVRSLHALLWRIKGGAPPGPQDITSMPDHREQVLPNTRGERGGEARPSPR